MTSMDGDGLFDQRTRIFSHERKGLRWWGYRIRRIYMECQADGDGIVCQRSFS
jgi:hypothetical protein